MLLLARVQSISTTQLVLLNILQLRLYLIVL